MAGQMNYLNWPGEYAEIDNYAEIARLKELQVVRKMMEKFNNSRQKNRGSCCNGGSSFFIPTHTKQVKSRLIGQKGDFGVNWRDEMIKTELKGNE